MTVFVDPPLWAAHGRLWSHVASDTSLEELHSFAERARIPRRSFEGDHYDVPQERYDAVVAAGATPVSGTELARRLRDSGLRFRKRKGERPLGRFPDGLADAVPTTHVLDVVASPHERPGAGAAVVLIRSGESDPRMVLVRNASRAGWAAPGGKREDTDPTVRHTAVREVVEEIDLTLDPAALRPVGYERITIPPGGTVGTLEEGDNYLQVYAVRLPEASPLTPDLVEVVEAEWVTKEEARRRCGDAGWWPLAQWWWDHDDA